MKRRVLLVRDTVRDRMEPGRDYSVTDLAQIFREHDWRHQPTPREIAGALLGWRALERREGPGGLMLYRLGGQGGAR